MRGKRLTIFFEITLLVMMSFSVSYFIHEADKNRTTPFIYENKIGVGKKAFEIYRIFTTYVIGDKGIVSAASATGVYTCLEAKDASICQEYTSESLCASECASTCIPTPRNQVAQCKIGTCYDKVEGTCQAGSPKAACEEGEGKWLDDPNGNAVECRRGCCVVGEQTFFATAQECTRKANLLGINKEFRPEITTELACLILSNSQEEGACVFEYEFENTCKFTTKSNCLEIQGDFHSGYLCSNPELETNCEKQATAKCVDNKDGLYWFDSCGNRENIYDANKVRSYNDGKVAAYNETCSLGSTNNPFANQKTCGNCNYLLGSRCEAKTTSEKVSDNTIDYVCRDLRCKDGDGNIRENGESWCAYNSAIGVDKGIGQMKKKKTDTSPGAKDLLRSIDTPGSRHFRQVCIDGTVRTEPCADYRNEICVEAQSKVTNTKTFSSAACRINKWQECLNYNTETSGKKGAALKEAQTTRDNKCEENPDCFVKQVNIDKNFKFNICAPKYPGGFDLSANAEGAEGICSLASQKCTAVYVKGFSGWKCKQNCNCVKKVFAEQMNDLCMSLGDCGASVNYMGDLSQSYSVKKSPKLNQAYLTAISAYANPIKNRYAEPGNITGTYGELGIPEGLGEATPEGDNGGGMMLPMIVGGMGVALAWAATTTTGLAALSSIGLASQITTVTFTAPSVIAGGGGGGALGAIGGSSTTTIYGAQTVANPGLSAFGGGLAGAAIGFAVTNLLITFLVPGLDKNIAMALSIAGAIGGGLAGAAAATAIATEGLGFAQALGGLGPIGIGIFIAVVVIIVIMSFLGIGKTKKVVVKFTCDPWQAPNGGAKCDQCGQDTGNAYGVERLPCSKYSCQALGQTCEFINEGTGQELCVDVSPNDASAPVIKPLNAALAQGFSYTNVAPNGYTLTSGDNDGCLRAYSPASFGIELDEPGQCKMDVIHTPRFEDMEFEFGGRSLYMKNHSMIFSVPSLESLGISGYDPNRKASYSLYVRCKDKTGNANVNEYTINFCVKPGIDTTPPIVTSRDPLNEYVRDNVTELDARIFVNEPSECRWDTVDKDYDIMNKTLNCNTDVEDQASLFGWECATKFPVSNDKEQRIYIRCKDQPWLVEDAGTGSSSIIVSENPEVEISEEYDEDSDNINQFEEGDFDDPEVENTAVTVPGPANAKRNKNMESYIFKIKKSQNPLKIDSVSPNNQTLSFGTEPVSVNVEVVTSGGADGKAECFYKFGDQYIAFFETISTVHKQTFESMSRGARILPIMCQDIAGNTANTDARFTIDIDNRPPLITRVYEQAGLTVVTDEPGQCYVSNEKCNFEIVNSTLMSGDQLVHSTSFDRSLTYYVKCKDKFENTQGVCGLIVKGGVI